MFTSSCGVWSSLIRNWSECADTFTNLFKPLFKHIAVHYALKSRTSHHTSADRQRNCDYDGKCWMMCIPSLLAWATCSFFKCSYWGHFVLYITWWALLKLLATVITKPHTVVKVDMPQPAPKCAYRIHMQDVCASSIVGWFTQSPLSLVISSRAVNPVCHVSLWFLDLPLVIWHSILCWTSEEFIISNCFVAVVAFVSHCFDFLVFRVFLVAFCSKKRWRICWSVI